MEQILTDIGRIKKRQNHTRKDIQGVIDQLIMKLDQFLDREVPSNESEFNQSVSSLFNEVKGLEPLRKVCRQHKESYAYISKLGKSIEQNFLCNPEQMNSHKVEPLQAGLIDEIIHEFLVREGHFQEAELLEKHKGIAAEIIQLKEQFRVIFSVIQSLKEGSISSALQWVEDNCKNLEGVANTLLFNIHKLKYIHILREGQTTEALNYIKNYMQGFRDSHLTELQHLMGACLFLSQSQNTPYQEMLDPTYDDKVASQLLEEWCKLLGLSPTSSLMTAVSVGTYVIPEIIQIANIIGTKVWTSPLPTELKMDNNFIFHSIFVCPVSKEIATPDNPPMLLPCGHMICKQSVEMLLKSTARNKVKCPTCPVEAVERDVKQLSI